MGHEFQTTQSSQEFVDEMIPAPVYKRFQVKDRYNQMVLTSGNRGWSCGLMTME